MDFGLKTFQRIAERSRARQVYSKLAEMDDHLLSDIGITRDEVRAQLMRSRVF